LAATLEERLIHVEADGNAIPWMAAVVQIIAITVVVHVDVIAVIPIVGPVFRPRVDQTEPIPAVLEATLPADIHHGEDVDAEPVILAIVAAETVIGNAVAVVSAALLPSAVLRPPAMGTITLPSDLLYVYLLGAALLYRPVVLLLALLPLLVLLPSDLLLLRRVILLLTLLALLILLPLGLLLLLLFRGVVLLLTLLALLILLPLGLLLLLLFRGVVLLLTLLLLFRSLSLLLLMLFLLLRSLGLLLFLRFSLLLLRGFGLFFLFLLPCARWSNHSG
jgi:hypothetical protein